MKAKRNNTRVPFYLPAPPFLLYQGFPKADFLVVAGGKVRRIPIIFQGFTGSS